MLFDVDYVLYKPTKTTPQHAYEISNSKETTSPKEETTNFRTKVLTPSVNLLYYFRNPFLLYPGRADKKNLQPAYEIVQKAIREIDDQHNIFFEGVTWDWFKVGFTKVPGGDNYQNRYFFDINETDISFKSTKQIFL